MDGFRPSSSSNLESRADSPVSQIKNNTLIYKKHLGIKQGKSGRWTAQISFGKSNRYLGTFKTADEAAKAFSRARMERDSMKKKQKLDCEEAQKSLTNCKVMKFRSCVESTYADKAMDGFRPSSSSLNCSNNESRADAPVSDSTGTPMYKKYMGIKQEKSGRWTAQISIGKSKRYLGIFKTAEEAANAFTRARMERDSMKKKRKLDCKEAQKSLTNCKEMKSKSCVESSSADKVMDGIRPSSGSLKCSNNESRADVLGMKKKYMGVMQTKSGRWSSKIKFGRYSTRHLGTFEKAKEAADAYASARMERDLKKRKQEAGFKETCKSLIEGNDMMSKPCSEIFSGFSLGSDEDHWEAEKACSIMEGDVGSLVLTKRELKRQQECDFGKTTLEMEYPDLMYKDENFGVTVAADSLQRNRSYTSNTRVIGNLVIPNLSLANGDEENLGTGIINSYGQLIGEYSRLDDQLWLCRSEEDDVDDNVYDS